MSDDTQRLEELAALHSKGALTDEEFAQAKASVLSPEKSESAADLTDAVTTAVRQVSGESSSTLGAGIADDDDKPLWRRWRILAVAAFVGFLLATAGIAIVPDSALWTGRLLCSGGSHLVSDTSAYHLGPYSGTQTGFGCVGHGAATSAPSLAILGLQWLLGTVVCYASILLIGALRRIGR